MNITIIGTTSYKEKILSHKIELEANGNKVKIPAFDDYIDLDEIGVCEYNLNAIKWADEVHILWDQRSTGTIFDLGMVFALKKPLKIIYLQSKTFSNLIEKYENKSSHRCPTA